VINSKGEVEELKELPVSSDELDEDTGKVKPHKKKYINKDGKIFEEESDDGIDKKTGKKRVKGKGPIKKKYRRCREIYKLSCKKENIYT